MNYADLLPLAGTDWLQAHSRRLADSYRQLTGEALIVEARDKPFSQALFEADFVLVSHDGGADPVLNYGNRQALGLWEMDWPHFTATPSRYTAEPEARQARRAMLSEAKEIGVKRDYSGIRISANGRRFMIEKAVIWTVLSEAGEPIGQAAMFRDWHYL